MRTPRDLDRAVERRFPGWFGWESHSLSWHAGFIAWLLAIGAALSFVLFLTLGAASAWSTAVITCSSALGALLALRSRIRRDG